MKGVWLLFLLALSCKATHQVGGQTSPPCTVTVLVKGGSNSCQSAIRALTKLATVDIVESENDPFCAGGFYSGVTAIRVRYNQAAETVRGDLRRELGQCPGIMDVQVVE